MRKDMLTLEEANTAARLTDVAALLTDYADMRQGDPAQPLVRADIQALPGPYAPPQGALLLARQSTQPVGCVAIRPLDADTCELKRLYVTPSERGSGLGRRLCIAIMRLARRHGYLRMRLDAVPSMDTARPLYATLGFERIPPYWENPNPGTWYFEIDLAAWCAQGADNERYLKHVHTGLGITETHITTQALKENPESTTLSPIAPDMYARTQRLAEHVIPDWQAMLAHARRDGISLQLVSAFRSVEYQAGLIAQKCQQGRRLEDVLTVNAVPGYSEHHSGRAVDVSCEACDPLSEAFEKTATFAWLQREAGTHGFHMSYGCNTPSALVYEPWHWAWQGTAQGTACETTDSPVY